MREAAQKTHLVYDADQHYDCISAFQKSIRGSDVDAALYWLGRMVEAGEDPRYITRYVTRGESSCSCTALV